MIRGITHSLDGVINANETWRGKISTGYAPGEGPNKDNYPTAAGFFRIMREESRVVHGIVIKEWKTNTPFQDILGKDPVNRTTPKTPCVIEFTCMYRNPEELWDSYMAKYGEAGLLCKSNGEGTVASCLVVEDDMSRHWVNRSFEIDGKACEYCVGDKCPDAASKLCKPHGTLKVFPKFDLSTSPYRFDTTSVNSIIQIEAMLERIWSLLQAAHAIRQREEPNVEFNGLLGTQWFLVHKQIKSGGKNVYITNLLPGKSLQEFIMKPIRQNLDNIQKMQLQGKTTVALDAPKNTAIAMDQPDDDVFDPSLAISAEAEVVSEAVEDDGMEAAAAALLSN